MYNFKFNRSLWHMVFEITELRTLQFEFKFAVSVLDELLIVWIALKLNLTDIDFLNKLQ